MSQRKQCIRCKEVKPVSGFKKDNSRKDRLHPYCKSCCALDSARYRRENKEKIRNYDKRYLKDDPEGVKRRQQNFRENSTELYLLGLARRRARRKGIEFSLTVFDVVIPKVCPVFGIPLAISYGIRSLTSPSIDRIDNTKGYMPNNVIIISVRANELKRDASIKELQQLATFYKRYEK